MYKTSEIKELHIELTTNCQASCPMCSRNYHGGIENPNIKVQNIDLLTFKDSFSVEFIQQIETISLCGNFGDPILCKDLLEIVEYIKTSNNQIRLDIHTNGSARSTEWWERLAKVMPDNHLVHFAIDGLEDTHSLYRIGTDFNRIIDNAKTFINHNGKARWVFITFKHNEHQLSAAREMAKTLHFDSFHEKQSARFIGNPWFDVYDKDKNVTHRLENPSEQKIIFIDKKTVDNYKDLIPKATIECGVEKSKSLYVDAYMNIWPCCFVGAIPYLYSTPEQLIFNFNQENQLLFNDIVKRLPNNSLLTNSIESIVDSESWQTVWDDVFKNKSLLTCVRVCGKFDKPTLSQSRDQFLNLEEFNE